METIDLQLKKLSILENIVSINDESIIDQMYNLITPKNRSKSVIPHYPLTYEAFLLRIETSENAILRGEVTSHEDFVTETENW